MTYANKAYFSQNFGDGLASSSYFVWWFLFAWLWMYVLTSELASGDCESKMLVNYARNFCLIMSGFNDAGIHPCYFAPRANAADAQGRTELCPAIPHTLTQIIPPLGTSPTVWMCCSRLEASLVPFRICCSILFCMSFGLWFTWAFFLFSVFIEFLKLHT